MTITVTNQPVSSETIEEHDIMFALDQDSDTAKEKFVVEMRQILSEHPGVFGINAIMDGGSSAPTASQLGLSANTVGVHFAFDDASFHDDVASGGAILRVNTDASNVATFILEEPYHEGLDVLVGVGGALTFFRRTASHWEPLFDKAWVSVAAAWAGRTNPLDGGASGTLDLVQPNSDPPKISFDSANGRLLMNADNTTTSDIQTAISAAASLPYYFAMGATFRLTTTTLGTWPDGRPRWGFAIFIGAREIPTGNTGAGNIKGGILIGFLLHRPNTADGIASTDSLFANGMVTVRFEDSAGNYISEQTGSAYRWYATQEIPVDEDIDCMIEVENDRLRIYLDYGVDNTPEKIHGIVLDDVDVSGWSPAGTFNGFFSNQNRTQSSVSRYMIGNPITVAHFMGFDDPAARWAREGGTFHVVPEITELHTDDEFLVAQGDNNYQLRRITDGNLVVALEEQILDHITSTPTGESDIEFGSEEVSGEHHLTGVLKDDTVGIDELSATGTPSATTVLHGDNAWRVPAGGGGGGTDDQTASEVSVDASGFDGNLATSDNTVQKVAQKLDDLNVGGTPRLAGSGLTLTGNTLSVTNEFTSSDESKLDGIEANAKDDQTAAEVSVDASGFDGNLSTSDNTVQKVAQKLDDLTISGGGGGSGGTGLQAGDITEFTNNTRPSRGERWVATGVTVPASVSDDSYLLISADVGTWPSDGSFTRYSSATGWVDIKKWREQKHDVHNGYTSATEYQVIGVSDNQYEQLEFLGVGRTSSNEILLGTSKETMYWNNARISIVSDAGDSSSGGASELNDLSDVDTDTAATALAQGDTVLAQDGSTGEYKRHTVPSLGGAGTTPRAAGTGLTLTGNTLSVTNPFTATDESKLDAIEANAKDDQSAAEVSVDASGFDGNLASTDNTVQKVAQKLDDLSVGGTPRLAGSGLTLTGNTLSVTNEFTSTDETKLDGIASGAEVNPAPATQAEITAGTVTAERVVQPNTLNAAIDAILAAGIVNVKPWTSGLNPAVGDLIRHGANTVFMCVQAVPAGQRTSGPDGLPNNYLQINAFVGTWSSVWYQAGAIALRTVSGENRVYISRAAVVGGHTAPENNSNWIRLDGGGSTFSINALTAITSLADGDDIGLADASNSHGHRKTSLAILANYIVNKIPRYRGTYAQSTVYVVGDTVTRSGNVLHCKTGHTSPATGITAENWEQLNAAGGDTFSSENTATVDPSSNGVAVYPGFTPPAGTKAFLINFRQNTSNGWTPGVIIDYAEWNALPAIGNNNVLTPSNGIELHVVSNSEWVVGKTSAGAIGVSASPISNDFDRVRVRWIT